MKEINDFLLNLFTGKDELRPALMFPNLKDGIVYATDAHVIIAIPETQLSLKYSTNDKYPNARAVLFVPKDKQPSIKVKISDIARELVKARILIDKKSLKCKECDGIGEVEWESDTHRKMDDCPVCDGKGCIEIAQPFARVSLSMIEDNLGIEVEGISIGKLHFHPFQLYRLFMVALVKGYEDIEIFFNQDTYGATITYFGDIKVGVMELTKGNGTNRI